MMKVFISLLIVISIVSFTLSLKTCQKSPKWRLSGKTFPREYHGKVKFVALLRATCPFCRVQADRLDDLKQELVKEGIDNISFLIVNPAAKDDFNRLQEFRSLTAIEILQDTEAMNVWDLYNGTTDDMFIFDRCNRLVKHLTLPDSDIKQGIVKAEIINAYEKRICSGRCRLNREKFQRKSTTLGTETTTISTTISSTECNTSPETTSGTTTESTKESTTESTTEITTESTTESTTENTTESTIETIENEETVVIEENIELDVPSNNSTDTFY